ncbi:MAG: tRNA (N(6)-L-threonylcarbamoyladenosine(37)-C(2))-methylthiotransferase MtaB [Bacilli bacterium]
MKFKIITLGCKVNTYESEMMKEKLLASNYVECDENPNIIIINTCSVTNMADNKSKKMIRSARANNPQALLIVCGCMAQNHQDKLNDLNVDILIGNKDKSKIVELIQDYQQNKKKIIKFYNEKKLDFEDMSIDKFSSHTRAFMKIQDGCNNYCSYCIIPYMRGSLRSKDINLAFEEAQNLVANGHKEIVLTGIHTGSYGREKDYDLVDLINKMSTIIGLERIRISSIEITEINDKFLDMLKNNPKVCNHLHIPLQSGSEEILKLMNRKYDKSLYKQIIDRIRNIRPNISISTDVIVGFPGETEEMFLECISFCEEMKFSKIHVFPYSRREGTKACTLPNHLDNSIKKCRARKLIEISNRLELQYNTNFIEQDVEVLIEEIKDGYSIGHTSNYLKVFINEILETNETYKIHIVEAYQEYVKGIIN